MIDGIAAESPIAFDSSAFARMTGSDEMNHRVCPALSALIRKARQREYEAADRSARTAAEAERIT